MADKKISELTEASLPLDGTEDLPIVQSGTTVRCSTQDIADLGLTPKVYAVRLTQSGTSAPTAAGVNTTGSTMTLARSSGGFCSITASSAVFTAGKTIISHSGTGSGGYIDPKLFAIKQTSTTVINIGAFRVSDQTAEDDFILDITISIYQ